MREETSDRWERLGQPPCDLRSCAWLLHPNIKNQGKGMSEVNRFGDEERRLMHLVPAPAVSCLFAFTIRLLIISHFIFLHFHVLLCFAFLSNLFAHSICTSRLWSSLASVSSFPWDPMIVWPRISDERWDQEISTSNNGWTGAES